MTLKLAGRNPARFEWAAGNMSAAFTLSIEDDQETILATLRRIIAFVEAQEGTPEPLPVREPGHALARAQEAAPAPPGNGWASFVQPEIPEHLQGDFELIKPEGGDAA